MKTETVKIVPVEELVAALRTEIGQHGYVKDMAQSLDMLPASLSAFLNGSSNPPQKVLEHYGLERRLVVVPKTVKGN